MKITLYSALVVGLIILAGGPPSLAQSAGSSKARVTPVPDASVKASPAYAELLLRRTELSAELESLSLDYTEEYPKVRESHYAIALLDRDLILLATSKPGEVGKLTLALGKLMVRRVELETELGMLQRTYKDDHPDVKRLKKKVEIYNSAIKQILN
jgi:hypothetical protein